jgi:PAS domain S-box-containing protein
VKSDPAGAMHGGVAGSPSAFWALFEGLPVGAVLFDPSDDGFVAFNDAACAQLGYDRAAFGRLRLSDIDVATPVDVHLQRRRALVPGAPPLRFQTLQRARDGGLRHVDITVQCIVLDERRLGYAVWHDVTDREAGARLLREREAELARVQRIGQLGGFEVDLRDQGFVNRRSPEYLHLHELPAEAVSEPHEAWVRRLHPEDRSAADARFRAAVHGTDTDYANEYRVVTPSGDVRWIRALAEIERDAQGRALRMVGAHLDVTVLKRTEAALAAQAARLLEADRRKDEFLAVLSHELRNPLAALTNALRLLARPQGQSDTPGTAGVMLDIAQRQVRQLTRLVDDLLEVSRISAGKIVLRLAPVPLDDVVGEAIASMSGQCAERGQRVSLDVAVPAPTVDADRARLVQVMENLLGNASKYSDPGGSIRVRVRGDGPADGGARDAVIEVEDDGIGIPSESQAEVFELFAQVGDGDRTHGGLGIGLALVRRLVELHGGAVDVFSEGPGRGSRFTVRLPLA